jgi:Nitroreductase family.
MSDSKTPQLGNVRKSSCLGLLTIAVALLFSGICSANPPANKGDKSVPTNSLPPPAIASSPFLQILQKRRTSRDYASRQLDRQTISNLLWAAYGINRPDDGKRTAPSAHDWQYIDIYVTDSNGLYWFNAKRHDLDLVKAGDIRAMTGMQQDIAAKAPFSLVYVFDERKTDSNASADQRTLFAATTAGAIVQNVYLYCAAASLNTGVRADIEREPLHKAMGLSSYQKILLAQSVGYPSTLGSLKGGIKSVFSQ